MRMITFDKPGSPEVLVLSDSPIPVPGAGEVLIKVKAAGVNRPDIAQRSGMYPPPPGASPVLGLEVAGEIEAIGEGVSEWKIGDKVCALTPGGGYAEYCLAPASHCLQVPQGLSFIEAAGIPETFFTVWSNVFMRGQLKAGETFLVHGGTSGIGTTAIQLAKKMGAKVFTTAGSKEKTEACLKAGADLAINYKEKDFVAEVLAGTNSRGVNVILDMVGGDYFSRNLKCLAEDGRLVQIAALQGAEVSLHLFQMMAKRITITGSTLRPQSIESKKKIAEELFKHVWPLIENKQIQVMIDSVYSLSDVKKAHERMETSQHIGKIVLDMEQNQKDCTTLSGMA